MEKLLAHELVRKMSDLLGSSKAFALEAEEVSDEVPTDLPRTQSPTAATWRSGAPTARLEARRGTP